VAAGTSGEAAAACWAEVHAAESVAFENLVVALENWVAASEMDDADPTLGGRIICGALKIGPSYGKRGLVLLPEGCP
jgi:hypothetical protein